MNVAGRAADENRAVSTADKLADGLTSFPVNNNRTPSPFSTGVHSRRLSVLLNL